MLYLDNKTCHHSKRCSHQFSAPIFSANKHCSIKWPDSKILYSVATTWQNVSGNTDKQLFFIQTESNDTKILLVRKWTWLRNWSGLSVRNLYCGRAFVFLPSA
jgi:hypothetical protein